LKGNTMATTNDDEYVDMTPATHMIVSYATQHMLFDKALCELIDNSFDAGALNVHIEFGSAKNGVVKHMTVSDDGQGCRSLVPMVQFGSHLPHDLKNLSHRQIQQQLGRYGIGAKDAMLWIGGLDSSVYIQSVHCGTRRALHLRWRDLYESGSWRTKLSDLMEPEFPAKEGEVGTQILVQPVLRRVPHGKAWDKLLDTLGYVYAPALNRGLQIVLANNRKGSEPCLVKPWNKPALEPGHVDEVIEVADKKARVYLGVVEDGARNDRPGITYYHGFRVIQPASSHGCAPYGIERVCGFVELDKTWVLNRNKDGLAKDEDLLYEKVFEVCQHLLKKAETKARALTSAVILDNVQSGIDRVIAKPNSKAKRNKGDTHGTKKPTGTGKKHKDAKETQPGETFRKGIRNNIRVAFIDWPGDERIGHYEAGGSVLLNTSHPVIQRLKQDPEDPFGLIQVVFALIGTYHVLHPVDSKGQRVIQGLDPNSDMVEQFEVFYGKALQTALFDGKRVVEPAEEADAKAAQ